MATPFMSLSLPTPSVTAGPAYATQNNVALTTIDSHNHTAGNGAMIPSAALSINADLPFTNFNATRLRSSRYYDQGSAIALAADVGCLYIAGGDLYYNNGSGTPIQLTAGAALNAASIGGIGGDYSTSSASEFYTAASKTFSLWQASTQSANLDCGNVIIREPGVASANGLTLKSPTSLGAAYSLTLPTGLPASTLPLTLSAAGVVSTSQVATAQIGDSAVTTAKIAAASVTQAKAGTDLGVFLAAGSYNISGTLLSQKGSITLANAGVVTTGEYDIAVTGMTTSGIVIACASSPAGEGSDNGHTASCQLTSNKVRVVVGQSGSNSAGAFMVLILKL